MFGAQIYEWQIFAAETALNKEFSKAESNSSCGDRHASKKQQRRTRTKKRSGGEGITQNEG